jgi:hypothetical protein
MASFVDLEKGVPGIPSDCERLQRSLREWGTMIRYFFDVIIDGEQATDEEGILLPGIEAARREASQSLADLARDELDANRTISRLAISVRIADVPICEVEFHGL